MFSIFKKPYVPVAALCLAGAAFAANFSSFAVAGADAGLTEAQKNEVREIVKSYLVEDPEIVVKAFEAFQAKKQMETAEAAKENVAKHKGTLTAKDLPSAGNPDGDVTVVEFFDYNCGYCKKALPDVQKLIEADKNVRVVFFEMPILSEESHMAAKWAYAAHKQGKYFEFHTALMSHEGRIDESVLTDIAKKQGLDPEVLKKEGESPEIAEKLQNNHNIAAELGIQGTPGFVVNDTVFPGYLGEDGLKKAVDDARSGKTAN